MFLSEPEWQAVLLSLKVSSLAVALSLPFGIFFSWLLVRRTFPGKALLDSILHLPLVLPPVVVGYLLLVAMGRRGFIGSWLYDWFGISFAFSWRGAVLAAAVMSFPLMVRAIRLALEGVDVKLEQAARTLGASRWRVFLTITLPLTLPGIIVGTVLAFARSLGEFGATITFVSNIPGETRTLPSDRRPPRPPQPPAPPKHPKTPPASTSYSPPEPREEHAEGAARHPWSRWARQFPPSEFPLRGLAALRSAAPHPSSRNALWAFRASQDCRATGNCRTRRRTRRLSRFQRARQP